MSDDPSADYPGGRQHERTTMAWLRTALAAVAVGLLTVRVAEPGRERWLVAVGAAIGVGGILAVAWQRTRRLQLARVTGPFGAASSVVVVASLLTLNVVGLVVAL